MTDFVLPIIVDEEGNLVVHETAEHACAGMEAIDVHDGVYDVFDAEGRRLVLVVKGEQVTLKTSPDLRAEPEELRGRLHRYIKRLGTDRLEFSDLDRAPTTVLIQTLLRFQRGEFSKKKSRTVSLPGDRTPLAVFLLSFLVLQIGVVLLRWWRSSDDPSGGFSVEATLTITSVILGLAFLACLALSVPMSLRDTALKRRFPTSVVLPTSRVSELEKSFPALKSFRSPGASSEIPNTFAIVADAESLDFYTGSSSPRLVARFPWGSVKGMSLGTGSQLGTSYPAITVEVASPEGIVQLPIVVIGTGLLGLGHRRPPVLAQIIAELESLRMSGRKREGSTLALD